MEMLVSVRETCICELESANYPHSFFSPSLSFLFLTKYVVLFKPVNIVTAFACRPDSDISCMHFIHEFSLQTLIGLFFLSPCSSLSCLINVQIETIGDAYCVAGGLHKKIDSHAKPIAQMALKMMELSEEVLTPDDKPIKVSPAWSGEGEGERTLENSTMGLFTFC